MMLLGSIARKFNTPEGGVTTYNLGMLIHSINQQERLIQMNESCHVCQAVTE